MGVVKVDLILAPPPSPPLGDGLYQTHIYFDNDNLDTYHEKVYKKDGSTLISLKWQGEEGGTCMFEVATPHSSLLKSSNLKERFEMPYQKVGEFLSVRPRP